MSRRLRTAALVLGVAAATLAAASAAAEDLYKAGSWPSLASDQGPRRVGDSLTVIVYQNSTAANSAQTGSRKRLDLTGTASSRTGAGEEGRLALDSQTQGSGQTGRSDRLVAQISVVVTEVLPNGDLRIEGEQSLDVNGEKSRIRVQGRVRPADVAADNTVQSSRIADARIAYGGSGFVSRSARPGLVSRLFSLLGLP